MKDETKSLGEVDPVNTGNPPVKTGYSKPAATTREVDPPPSPPPTKAGNFTSKGK